MTIHFKGSIDPFKLHRGHTQVSFVPKLASALLRRTQGAMMTRAEFSKLGKAIAVDFNGKSMTMPVKHFAPGSAGWSDLR